MAPAERPLACPSCGDITLRDRAADATRECPACGTNFSTRGDSQVQSLAPEPEPNAIRPAVRIGFALAVAMIAGGAQYLRVSAMPTLHGFDYHTQWLAAGALLRGENPYEAIRVTGVYPLNQGLHYPLWSVLPTLPLGWLPITLAVACFSAIGLGLMAYVVTGTPWLGALGAFPLVLGLRSAQWSPALFAAALMPSLRWLTVVKPQVGIPVVAYAGIGWRASVAGIVLVVASFGIISDWPIGWWTQVGVGLKSSPISWFGGPLVLLALLRWRTPEARLLLLMSIIPTSPWWYDAIVLWLCARTSREVLAMTLCSWVAGVAMTAFAPLPLTLTTAAEFRHAYGGYAIVGAYLPALVCVLRRPG